MNYRICPECKLEYLPTYRQQVCCGDECRKARRLRTVRESVKRARARLSGLGGRNSGLKPAAPIETPNTQTTQTTQTPASRAYADRLIEAKETRDAVVQRLKDRKAERARIAARLAAITAQPVAETVATREDGSRVIRRGNCPVASWM